MAEVRTTVGVVAGDETAADVAGAVRCRARYDKREGEWGIDVDLSGQVRQPTLVFAEAGDPLAGAALPLIDGQTGLFLPVAGKRPDDARVFVATAGADRLRLLAAAAVEAVADEALSLKLQTASDQVSPGAITGVDVVCTTGPSRAAPAVLLARLVDATGTGHVEWLPGPGRREVKRVLAGLAMACTWAAGEEEDDGSMGIEAPDVGPHPRFSEALFEGTTLWAGSQPVEAEVTHLEVPIPARPGRYRLNVLACDAAGRLATESVLLDARQGVRMLLDVPEVFTVGDRGLLAVMLENPQPGPVEVCLSVRPGEGLHMEALWVVGGPGGPRAVGAGNSVSLSLPPGQLVRLLARVEASRVGDGTATVELESAGGRQRVERTYHVFAWEHPEPAEPTASRPASIRVKRSVLLLLEAAEHQQDAAEGEIRGWRELGANWVATPLLEGERLSPGRLVVVRDTFTLARPLSDVVWRQRLPAACVPPAMVSSDFLSLGERSEVRLDSVAYSAERLAAGELVHECPMIVVRPGTYFLPPPEMTERGRALKLEVDPGEFHLVVPDQGRPGE
jgi:hypothetical protein